MKWYIASRTKHKDEVSSWVKKLEKLNQTVEYDWTKVDLLIPYDKNKKESSNVAKQISQTIAKTDVFIPISDASGTDMYVELGIAIAASQTNNKPKIYIVGEHNKRSLMHFHPSINHVDNIQDVFRIECPKILNNK